MIFICHIRINPFLKAGKCKECYLLFVVCTPCVPVSTLNHWTGCKPMKHVNALLVSGLKFERFIEFKPEVIYSHQKVFYL